jgi:hypothetical protein
MLTEAQLKARDGKLTASMVGVLMNGDEVSVHELWMRLIGAQEEPDLSDRWAVRLGEVTESLNLEWFERKHGPVARKGEVVVHPNVEWAATTLDGWSIRHNCPVECKHVGGFEPHQTVIDRYQPQMHWQMFVTGAKQAAFSVISGAREPTVDLISLNEAYLEELLKRARAFWRCVTDITPPNGFKPTLPPTKPERIVKMQGNNEWAANAADWRENREQARKFTGAEKALKAMVPDDAACAIGHGVKVSRDRAGRLSVKETE